MKENITIREFICNYESGHYNSDDRNTMIEAGWYDWFCDSSELKPRLNTMFSLIKRLSASKKIYIDNMYVFFKNNCPGVGELYDDFRFCDRRTGDVIYTVVPSSGHTSNKGMSEVWGAENNFKGPLVKGNWYDVEDYFGVRSAA